MFVPNFEAISHVTLVLGPENHLKSLVQKVVSLFYLTGLQYVLRYSFILTNPLLATMSFFFFSNLVRCSSKPQHIEI